MIKLRPFEILLIEVAIYVTLWIVNDYLATMLSLIFGSIFTLLLLISLVVEWIERSKVPRWYFTFMLVSALAPLIAAIIFLSISGGLEWMKN
ncbi:MAG: hypothetical protein SFU99_12070 [Saprospiraceae bacterium]|nr:hypothetical protein [Saprospiraceae bacterium]